MELRLRWPRGYLLPAESAVGVREHGGVVKPAKRRFVSGPGPDATTQKAFLRLS
jgi:hypothetical protein